MTSPTSTSQRREVEKVQEAKGRVVDRKVVDVYYEGGRTVQISAASGRVYGVGVCVGVDLNLDRKCGEAGRMA